MQASEGEAETDSMFVNQQNNRAGAGRASFTAAGRGAGGGGKSKGLLLVVLLIVAGIFGGSVGGRAAESLYIAIVVLYVGARCSPGKMYPAS